MVSAGARAYNRGLSREADEVFVFKTLIFNERICYSFAPNAVGYCLSCKFNVAHFRF